MQAKIKIAHLITGLHVGGAEMMLYKLLSRIDRQRFDNIVVSLVAQGPVGDKIAALDIPVYSLGMQRGRPAVHGLSSIMNVLARYRPLVLQTWMYHADLLGLVGGRLAGVPHIVWNVRCSNMELSRMTSWTMQVCAWLSGQPRAAIVNSEAGRVLHAGYGYHPQQWVVIPNGFDLHCFVPDGAARNSVRAELGLSAEAVLIGLIGRFDPMKGHATFLAAADALAQQYPHAHFVLAGRGVDAGNADLGGILAGCEVRRRVHLLGERADIPRLTAALDIATSASTYGEGFANVIGEAMACAVPCVVTDVGDSAAIVGNTGIVVPPRNAEAIVAAWSRLLDYAADTRSAMGHAARERIQKNYSLEHVVRTYESLYLSLENS